MLQNVLSIILLIGGICYAVAILYRASKDKEAFREEKGKLSFLAPIEMIIYFFGASGISDFLLNTLTIKKLKLMEDEKLPGTLVACCLMPCAIFSFTLLRRADAIDIWTLIPCAIAISIGSYIGSRLVNRIDGAKIKKIMAVALAISFVILVIRIIISKGASGTETSLTGIKLIIAVTLCFVTGLINMFGIPMKPTWTALFLILGLSPLSTLTMVQSVGYFGPLSGGFNIIKGGKYHQKMAVSAVIFGAIGAIIGVTIALSISPTMLNIVLLLVMALTIYSIFTSKPAK